VTSDSHTEPAALIPSLLARRWRRPTVRHELPHSQLDQQPSAGVRAQLERRLRSISGIERQPSDISVQGAEALCVPDNDAKGPRAAYIVGREFAHLHPVPDSSLHIALAEADARQAVDAGWTEFHPLAGSPELPEAIVLVYAPRDENEVDTVIGLRSSRLCARDRPRIWRSSLASALCCAVRPSSRACARAWFGWPVLEIRAARSRSSRCVRGRTGGFPGLLTIGSYWRRGDSGARIGRNGISVS
jgi:hypothetical protein